MRGLHMPWPAEVIGYPVPSVQLKVAGAKHIGSDCMYFLRLQYGRTHIHALVSCCLQASRMLKLKTKDLEICPQISLSAY